MDSPQLLGAVFPRPADEPGPPSNGGDLGRSQSGVVYSNRAFRNHPLVFDHGRDPLGRTRRRRRNDQAIERSLCRLPFTLDRAVKQPRVSISCPRHEFLNAVIPQVDFHLPGHHCLDLFIVKAAPRAA
jgi:hypothetical protein